MRTPQLVAIGLTALVASAHATLGQSGATPAQALKPGTALILGRVVEAGGTTPVAGALVVLNSPALGPTGATFSNGTPAERRRVMTDGQGRFLFRELPKGNYTIMASAGGYLDGAYGYAQPMTTAPTFDFALKRTLDLAEGERVGDVAIQLWKFGGISGRITDEAGEPMVGITVSVIARAVDGAGPVSQLGFPIPTDDRGMYHADVPPGDYIVATLMTPTTIPVSAVDDFARAQANGSVSSRAYSDLLSRGTAPLPQATGQRVGEFYLSASGNARLEGGLLVRYPTTFFPSVATSATAATVTVASGEEKNGIDIQLKPTITRRVSGTLSGPEGPAETIGVQLVVADAAVRGVGPAPIIEELRTMTDSAGRFTFLSVAPGRYLLRAKRNSSKPDPQSRVAPIPFLWATQEITVGDADLDAPLTLRSGARFSGRVEFAGSTAAPTNAMQTLVITPRPTAGSIAALVPSSITGVTEPDGRFTTAEIAPGPYTFDLTGTPPGWIVKSIMTGSVDALDVAVELPSDGRSGMVITLSDRISKLSGVVADSQGRPAQNANVLIYPIDRALWQLGTVRARRVQTAPAGRDGRYSFTGLPAGEFYVVALETIRDFSDPRVLSALAGSATRMTLADGETKAQDVRVIR